MARGRGGAARARQVQMWLPALTGPLPMIAGQTVGEVVEPAGPTMMTAASA